MKTILFSLCFLFCVTSVLSQETKIDSLVYELSIHIQKDTVRVKILNHLAFYNHRNDPKSAMTFAEQAGELSDEIKHPKGKARSIYMKGIIQLVQADLENAIQNLEKSSLMYADIGEKSGIAGCNNALGIIYDAQGEYELALESYNNAMMIDEELGIEKNIPNYLSNMGNIYSSTGDYTNALVHFKKALDQFVITENDYGIFNCLNGIATVYSDQGNYPLSLEYNNKSLVSAEKAKDTVGIFQSLTNIGNLYWLQGKGDQALDQFKQALAIQQSNYNPKHITVLKNNMANIYIDKKEFDTAIVYLELAIELSEEIGDFPQISASSINLGCIYLDKEIYSTALDYFNKALELSLKSQTRLEQARAYLGIAQVYYKLNNNELALVNADSCIRIAEELKLIKEQRDAHKLISSISKQMGNYEDAFNNYKEYKVLHDSLFNKKSIEKITQLEYEYKYKQKLDSASYRELKLTKKVETTYLDLKESQHNLLLGVIAFLLVTLILGGVIFFLKLRNVKSKTQNAIVEQKLLRSQMTPHFIFNSLSVLQGMILNKEKNKAITYLSRFSKLLRITLENSRDKMVSLDLELQAIEDYLALQNIEASQPYNYTIFVEDTIDKTLFQIPPMLIQPFIENAIEHGFIDQKDNKEIDIKLTYSNEKLSCVIMDNGIGFEAHKESKKSHKKSLATTITAERLEILSKDSKNKGSITIADRKQFNEQGAIITLVIPYVIKEIDTSVMI